MTNKTMFCPKCGKADQQSETFCRQCGNYLYDFDKPVKKEISPEQHLKANTVLNLMSAIVSLTLAILLFSLFLPRKDTPPIIYITAGFLVAITAWQIQTFWRTILLKKQFEKKGKQAESSTQNQTDSTSLEPKTTNELLPEASFENYVRASVIKKTTRGLKTKKLS